MSANESKRPSLAERCYVAVFLALALGACNGPAQPPPEDLGPVRIGLLATLTGPYEFWQPFTQSLRLAVFEVNSTGGLLGGRSVELVEFDAASPRDTRDGYRHLVTEEEVHAVLGPYSGYLAIEVAPFAHQQRMPTMTLAGAGIEEWEDANPADDRYAFSVFGDLEHKARVTARALPEIGCSRPLFVTAVAGTDTGVEFVLAFREEAESLGVELAGVEILDALRLRNADAIVQQYQDNLPDCIVEYTGGPQIITFAQAWERSGLPARPVLFGLGGDVAFLSQDFSDYWTEGYIVHSRTSDPTRGAFISYRNLHEETYGEWDTDLAITDTACTGYDAAAVMLLAFERAGSTDGTAVRDAIYDLVSEGRDTGVFGEVGPGLLRDGLDLLERGSGVHYQGASGDFFFGADGRAHGRPHFLFALDPTWTEITQIAAL